MTTFSRPTNLEGLRWPLAAFAMLLTALAIISAVQFISPSILDQKARAGQTSGAALITELAPVTALTPVIALNNGNPSLFLFVPQSSCSDEACGKVAEVEQWVAEQYGARLNVVEIPVPQLPADATPATALQYFYAAVGLYPVDGVAEWLPVLGPTENGYGLAETTFVLLDNQGNRVHSGTDADEVLGMISAEITQ